MVPTRLPPLIHNERGGSHVQDLSSSAIALIHQQLGSISCRQLTEQGVTRRARERLVNDGVLIATGHSVYRVPACPLTLEARIVALCLQHPMTFITGATGGGLEGLRRMPRASKVQLCSPHGLRLDVPNWVQLRQSNRIEPHHVRTLQNGIRIASLPRLAFDLGADLTPLDLLSVMEQMRHERGLAVDKLFTIAGELCGPRRPGSANFVKALFLTHGVSPVESDPELRVLRALRNRGIPVIPQVDDLELPNGQKIRIDMAVPAVRWAVEVDLHPTHFGVLGMSRDTQRDRQCHLIDWQVDRVSPLDYARFTQTIDELEQLYITRCEALARRL
jgi:hypothetical protein